MDPDDVQEEMKMKIELTSAQQQFIRPLLMDVKLGERVKEHLGNFLRLVLLQNGYAETTKAYLDMVKGDCIVIVPAEVPAEDPKRNVVLAFPPMGRPS